MALGASLALPGFAGRLRVQSCGLSGERCPFSSLHSDPGGALQAAGCIPSESNSRHLSWLRTVPYRNLAFVPV